MPLQLYQEDPVHQPLGFKYFNSPLYVDFQNDVETRALTRLATHKLMVEKVKAWRDTHDDWKDLAAFMCSKNTGRRFKKKPKPDSKEIRQVSMSTERNRSSLTTSEKSDETDSENDGDNKKQSAGYAEKSKKISSDESDSEQDYESSDDSNSDNDMSETNDKCVELKQKIGSDGNSLDTNRLENENSDDDHLVIRLSKASPEKAKLSDSEEKVSKDSQNRAKTAEKEVELESPKKMSNREKKLAKKLKNKPVEEKVESETSKSSNSEMVVTQLNLKDLSTKDIEILPISKPSDADPFFGGSNELETSEKKKRKKDAFFERGSGDEDSSEEEDEAENEEEEVTHEEAAEHYHPKRDFV